MTLRILHDNITFVGKLLERLKDLREGLRHAFSVEEKKEKAFPEEELILIKRLARAITTRRMGTPAVLFLESLQPLSYIGSQVMAFFRPFMTFLFSPEEYDRLAHLLERRSSIEALIEEIKKAEEDGS